MVVCGDIDVYVKVVIIEGVLFVLFLDFVDDVIVFGISLSYSDDAFYILVIRGMRFVDLVFKLFCNCDLEYEIVSMFICDIFIYSIVEDLSFIIVFGF